MQAKLPDVNARLVRYMNAAQNAYDMREYPKAATSFEATIALLPEDYQVSIDSVQYSKLSRDKHNIICRGCDAEIERNKIYPYKLLLSDLSRLVTGQNVMTVWKCPGCNNVRALRGSKTKLVRWKQPFYFKVIPDPPARQGLHDRIGFAAKFEKWFDIACKEIEHQIGLYRTEYASQQSEVMVDTSDE